MARRARRTARFEHRPRVGCQGGIEREGGPGADLGCPPPASQFVYVIRKRIKLAPEKAIFIFVDEVLPPTAALMSSIYEEHKFVLLISPARADHPVDSLPLSCRDDDGFLYVSYRYAPRSSKSRLTDSPGS